MRDNFLTDLSIVSWNVHGFFTRLAGFRYNKLRSPHWKFTSLILEPSNRQQSDAKHFPRAFLGNTDCKALVSQIEHSMLVKLLTSTNLCLWGLSLAYIISASGGIY